MTSDLKILICGGTIDKVHNMINETLEFADYSHIPQILQQAFVTDTISHEIVMMKDSLDMTDLDRGHLSKVIQKTEQRKIVITHGTSTMQQTAEYLARKHNDKTIVLVGAMRPFSLSKSDAEFNLGFAIGAVKALPNGVYATMNGNIFPAGQFEKNISMGVFQKT